MQAKSLGDMLRTSCLKFEKKAAMLYPEGSEFREVTYGELREKVRGYAGAVRNLGLQRGDRLCIQSDNRVEWAWTDWACQSLGIVLVPIYPTLPEDQAQYIVKDSGAKAIVVGGEEQAAKTRGMEGVRQIEITELNEQAKTSALPEDEWSREVDQAMPDDLATIIYTSGTTGPPKGAMIPHRAFTHVCHGAIQTLPIDHNDVFLSFLPMSHVYERVAGQALPISCGATIAYAKSLASLSGDMMKVQPTVMLCVPRFLEAVKDRITDTVRKGGGLKYKLFQMNLAQGVKKAQGGFAPFAGLLDKVVGKKIRERTGGRMRFFVSGGAALPPHVAEFYMAFNLTVLQGYGLTETTAATCVNHPDRNKYWTVGEPLPGVEVSIAGDGEILVRGPSVMQGYFNQPEATAQAIDAEGWFHTGDIGEFEGPHLKITDRKKDILVLANGKNIAPQPIENKLKESAYIAEAVLFGDGNEYVYGLIIPNLERLREEIGGENDDEALVKTEQARAIIKREVDQVNRTLADFEKVKKHALLNAAFSVETCELTPSMKVKRKVVQEKFAAVLAGLTRA